MKVIRAEEVKKNLQSACEGIVMSLAEHESDELDQLQLLLTEAIAVQEETAAVIDCLISTAS